MFRADARVGHRCAKNGCQFRFLARDNVAKQFGAIYADTAKRQRWCALLVSLAVGKAKISVRMLGGIVDENKVCQIVRGE